VRFLVISARGRERLVVPLSPSKARERGLRMSVSYTGSGKLYWWVLRLLSRFGALGLVTGHSTTPPTMDNCSLNWSQWLTEIGLLLGQDVLVPAYYFPPQEGRGKAAVLLMDPEGSSVAFAKVGWNSVGIKEVEREMEIYKFWTFTPPRNFNVVKLIGSIIVKPQTLTAVYSPIPDMHGQGPADWCADLDAIWQELVFNTGRIISIERLPWWSKCADWGTPWDRLQRAIQQEFMSGIEVCLSHGDLAPWNIRVGVDGQLWLFDWEAYDNHSPRLTDLVHFFLSRAAFIQRRSPRKLVGPLMKQLLNASGAAMVSQSELNAAFVYLRSREDKAHLYRLLDALATHAIDN